MDKRNIRTDEFNPDRDKFKELVDKAGFQSMAEYCRSIGMARQTLENNLSGRYGISVPKILIMATGLGLPVDALMDVFYPELMKENRRVTAPVEKLSEEV